MQHTLHSLQRMDDIPPTDPYKKQRERARAESAELDRTDTMRVTRPANEWHLSLRDRKAYSEELFGPLWRVGEVALLFGARGVGKSTLAVQIAESIARGRPLLGTRTLLSATNAKRSKGSRRRGEKVLYVDMQRSEAQWAERYTLPSPIPGKPPRRYRFAKNLDRAGIDWMNVDLEAYNRDPVKYALRSIFHKIEDSRAKVVIIDDIELGGANALGRKGILRTMQTLRMWAATEGLSILVLSSSSPPYEGGVRLQPGGGSLRRSRHSLPITRHFSLADSVFALAPSTFGPQYRYIKHLASVSSPPYEPGSPPEHLRGGVDVGGVRLQPGGGSPDEVLTFASGNSPLSALRCPLVGFAYLGLTSEEQHLIDYAAEALHAQRAEERQLKRSWKRSSKEILVDGLIDGSYVRYLKGE